MPGKSRHTRRKLSQKKKKSRHVQPVVAVQQAVTPAPKPQTPKPAAPSAVISTPLATQAEVRYPYILTELRRIGILAGIVVAILIVLALILS